MGERQPYGSGGKIRNWNEYNPWGAKITPFKEEKSCALCDRVADVLFPIGIELCPKCVVSVKERTDIYKIIRKRVDFTGHFCFNCGNSSIVYYDVKTRVCHSCTVRLGKNQKQYREVSQIARKVV
jgi:ribosomal protein S27E